MYQVAVKREFIAQHYLTGGNWGAENQLHSHHYQIELVLQGEQLDQHDYLVDIVEIENALNSTTARYRDRTLNDLPEFAGVNPSIERFACHLCQILAGQIHAPNLLGMLVKLWENDIAWASYHLALKPE